MPNAPDRRYLTALTEWTTSPPTSSGTSPASPAASQARERRRTRVSAPPLSHADARAQSAPCAGGQPGPGIRLNRRWATDVLRRDLVASRRSASRSFEGASGAFLAHGGELILRRLDLLSQAVVGGVEESELLCRVRQRLPRLALPDRRGQERRRGDGHRHLAELAAIALPERAHVDEVVKDRLGAWRGIDAAFGCEAHFDRWRVGPAPRRCGLNDDLRGWC